MEELKNNAKVFASYANKKDTKRLIVLNTENEVPETITETKVDQVVADKNVTEKTRVTDSHPDADRLQEEEADLQIEEESTQDLHSAATQEAAAETVEIAATLDEWSGNQAAKNKFLFSIIRSHDKTKFI